MKATLKFDLPEESQEHLCALHGWQAFGELSEIRRLIRSYRKHGGDGTVATAERLIEDIDAIVRVSFGGIEV